MEPVIVIGAGLAGSEAAWQLAQRGVPVTLREMKPSKMTPAHHTEWFGELVCSNSLRSDQLENAVGLLKEELRRMDSLILSCADAHRVEAGGALAVDRHGFARAVTEKIRAHPLITVEEGEVTQIPESGNVIVASGPLTSDPLAEAIRAFFPESRTLNFYDAAAPLVTFESVDMDSAFFASRYDRGTPDYINCPMTEEEYDAFWAELCAAQEAEVHGFEDKHVFEGCMPVEVMARRGKQTLCYGPLKPRGLNDPKTGKEPFAVVQLRRDNADGTIYNLVGFQTHLKWPEQRRVFSMIPALRNAEFVRYGVMHRNTYLDSPRLLDAINRNFDLSRCLEFTVEGGRPDTLDPQKLCVIKDGGATRISINPQTMSDKVLEAVGRRHTARQTVEAYEQAVKAGFDDINMDLIAGLPADDAAGFADSIRQVLDLNPSNITVHTLALKKGAALFGSRMELPSQEAVAAMLAGAEDALRQNGYEPYYLYRQKYMSGSFENTGWCRPGYTGLYNIYMMEELHTILSLGGGGMNKINLPAEKLARYHNPKIPQDYISRIDTILQQKDEIFSLLRQIREQNP